MIQTIIAPSIHRAKEIERLSNQTLTRSLTLDNFILAYHERYAKERLIDAEEALTIIAGLFMKYPREHFDYITAYSDAMEQIAGFIIDIKRNGVSIDEFQYPAQKEKELKLLFQNYNDFLQQNSLHDRADAERFVMDSVKNDSSTLKPFGEIVVDDFSQNGIHFETSKTQMLLLEVLRKNGQSISNTRIKTEAPIFYEPFPKPFDIFDEVAAALKIARKLLDSKVHPDDILIVTPSIEEYAPIFETLYSAYGLNGYTSIGTSLSALLPLLKKQEEPKDELLLIAQKRYKQILETVDKTAKRLSAMGIDYNKTQAREKAISKAKIKLQSSIGIQVSEPNQLHSFNRIEHLIFVGTDMGHFPPLSQDGFLVTTAQKESMLHANSTYLSSLNHYMQMKAITHNLYIVTATYKSKTKLARSHIINEQCIPYDITQIKASFEMPRYAQRSDDSQLDHYLHSIAQEQSPYDGYDAGGYQPKTLSASQLGTYAMCPRRYFFDRVLGISAPETPEEGLEAKDKGTIMHKCFELFAKDAKARKIMVGNEADESLKEHMLITAQTAYEWFMKKNNLEETINHRLYFQELTRGLSASNASEGVLSNFLTFITLNSQAINNFQESEFEMQFMLDSALSPVKDEKSMFIQGYIDRIDIKDDEIRIVDYKSKKAKGIDKDKLAQMNELRDMQLALYVLYARRMYGDIKIESYLQTFNSEKIHAEFAKMATFEAGKEDEFLLYDDEFEQRLIERIAQIQHSMSEGDFHYDDGDDKQCEYCDYTLMCR